MVHQLALCHASNMRAAQPARLTFAGLAGALAEGHATTSGYDKWPVRHFMRCCVLRCAAARGSRVVVLRAGRARRAAVR